MTDPKFMSGKTLVERVAWMMDSERPHHGCIDLNGYRFEFDEDKLQDLLTVVYALLRQIEYTNRQTTLKDMQEIVQMIGDIEVPERKH